MKVKLFARDKTVVRVAEIQLLGKAPDVITWNDQTFLLALVTTGRHTSVNRLVTSDEVAYIEASTYELT